MVILALDSSSAGGSVAVVRTDNGSVLVRERAGDSSRATAERLPLELMGVLDDAAVTLDDVDLLAVGIGPGSYTGLRVGIAAMQGLALARGLRVAPVSTFEALAWHAKHSTDPVATWVDAHRGEVFATLFAADGRTVLAAASSLSPAATLEAWRAVLSPGTRARFMGDGAVRYHEAIQTALGDHAAVDMTVPLLAGAIGRIAAEEPTRGGRPHALAPLYIRRTDVELARERREAAQR